MATPILLPRQGQSVESCIITEFYVKENESVAAGDLLFAYETDKASFEEEASEDGIILTWFFEEGDEVPVLTNVGVIGQAGESVAEFDPAKGSESAAGSGKTGAEEMTVGTGAASTGAAEAAAGAAEATSGVDKASSTTVQGSAGADKAKAGAHEHPAGADSLHSAHQASAMQGAKTGDQSMERADPDRIFISPRARKLAEKHAIEIATISGSGPQGRIIEADIETAIHAQPRITPLAKKMISEGRQMPPSTAERQRVTSADLVYGADPVTGTDQSASAGQEAGLGQQNLATRASQASAYEADSEIVELPNIRKMIARAMHQSLQHSAQLTHHLGADARNILAIRQAVKQAQKEGYPHNITLNDMICFAVVKTLQAHPRANAHFLGDKMRLFKKVHLGLAVDTERGLMVPAVKNADDLSITGLSSQMQALATSSRKGNIDPDLLSPEAASFTVSNLGNYGVEMFTPVINLPQVAILGVNTILPRPKDLGSGTYGFVPHLGLSLTYDHQALDGGEATRFLKDIAVNIENLEIAL